MMFSNNQAWSSALDIPILGQGKKTPTTLEDSVELKDLQIVKAPSPATLLGHTSRSGRLLPSFLLHCTRYIPIPALPNPLKHLTIPKFPVIPPVPVEHAHRSQIAQKWILSRITPEEDKAAGSEKEEANSEVSYREAGNDRPISMANIRLALSIIGLIWKDVLRLFFSQHQLQMAVYILGKLIWGTIPAARIWATSALLDIVQESFSGRPLDTNKLFRIAGLAFLFKSFFDIFSFFTKSNDAFVRSHITRVFQERFLQAQLSLSLPDLSSPYASAIVDEAAVMAGLGNRTTLEGYQMSTDAYLTLDRGMMKLPELFVKVISQVVLLLAAVDAGSSTFAWSSAFYIALALMPASLQLIGQWIATMQAKSPDETKAIREVRRKFFGISSLGSRGGYTQEVVLYGLGDWVMAKWGYFRNILDADRESNISRTGYSSLSIGLLEEASDTAFYVVVAMRVLPTSLTFGLIQRCQSSSRALLNSVRSVGRISSEVFQTIFYLAAFIELMDLPNNPEKLLPAGTSSMGLLDYDTIRQEAQGMAIQAVNMDFTYPGSKKPTLTNINLTIPSGSTLAIVGFNGGGKTTLVKALMGLYAHQGALLINGTASEEIDPRSLHKRTSCLFQDFSRFSLTLRENVGIGNVALMEHDESIIEAIEQGDAKAIQDKVGLEGMLNRFGVPPKADDEDDKANQGKSAGQASPPSATLSGSHVAGSPSALQLELEQTAIIAPQTSALSSIGPSDVARTTPPKPLTPISPTTAGSPDTPLTPVTPMTPTAHSTDKPTSEDKNKDKDKDKGTSLSGGQWQRVALSRAFLRAKEADLVVFDEPSSALDPKAEAELFQRIHALSHHSGRKTTTIYISHRFATVKKADQIAFVENGTIIECGTHSELMALEGRYHEFYTLQKEGFDEP